MLGRLIEFLESLPPDAVIRHGFGEPFSYRGNYYDVAFDPVENAIVGDMLRHAKFANGATFQGYKGGEFTMDADSYCWICEYGESGGDKIGPTLMRYWQDECDGQSPPAKKPSRKKSRKVS